MKKYYVNKQAQSTGEHEVHTEDCRFLPDAQNREYLGEYSSCEGAVAEARRRYTKVDGCYHCCRECHKS